jgi:hypothetical protein
MMTTTLPKFTTLRQAIEFLEAEAKDMELVWYSAIAQGDMVGAEETWAEELFYRTLANRLRSLELEQLAAA